MQPDVSIVIPIYNGERYISSCIDCLKAQDYQNIEIILINDGSTDKTGFLCDEYAKLDNRVKVIHQVNAGLSAARNAGIYNATGKYVLFFDVDDTIEPNTISDNIDLAERYQADVVLFCFWYYNVDKNILTPNNMDTIFLGNQEEFFHKYLISTINNEVFNAPWNKLIKRENLIKNDVKFDTNYPIYEDIIFAPLLLSISKTIVVNPNMYYKYFVKSSGSLITGFYPRFFESVTKFYDNAMNYCAMFDNNFLQIQCLSTLYCRLVIWHIKQIHSRKELKKHEKNVLLNKIYTNPRFNKALKDSNLSLKKRLIKYLILHKHFKLCNIIYKMYN